MKKMIDYDDERRKEHYFDEYVKRRPVNDEIEDEENFPYIEDDSLDEKKD